MTDDVPRKYITEWTVSITVSVVALGRPQDFQKMQAPKTDYPCHLYIVSRRPRMSIKPSSVMITNREVSGVLRLQREDSWNEFPFKARNGLGPGPWRWTAEWPYEDFEIKNASNAMISGGVVANLQEWITDWPDVARKHEIVYIGQAFGHAGERTAWDRLKSHETVQRILAETTPDKQVWLALAGISDVNLFSEVDPRRPTEKSSAEDDNHSKLVILRKI
jgi:hypothetical protein